MTSMPYTALAYWRFGAMGMDAEKTKAAQSSAVSAKAVPECAMGLKESNDS